MADWATVLIVLGTCFITNFLTWFLTKRQVAHSVRSEPLLKLRIELARMAAKGERVASLVIPFPFGEESKEKKGEFMAALNDWNTYMASGEFEQVLFMQTESALVDEVEHIRQEYDIARYRFGAYWQWLSNESKTKDYDEAVSTIVSNRRKIAEVQSEINVMLEKL